MFDFGNTKQLQIIQEERNSKSKKIGEISLNGNKEEASKLKEEVSSLKSKLQELDLAQKNVQGALNDILSRIPNLPHESVPVGDESKNEEIKLIGEKKNYTFDLKEHFDLGEELGAMSFEEASNNSRHILIIVSFEYLPFDNWISRFKTSCSLLSSITPLVLSLSFPIEVTIFDLRSIRSTILLSKSFIWRAVTCRPVLGIY